MRRAIAVFLLVIFQMVNIHHASAAPSDLRLIAQNFNVASDRQFRFVFNVSDDQLREQLGESNTATITVRAYPAVTTTAELTAALDSQPDAEPVAVFGALTRRLERTSTGDFVVLIAAGRGVSHCVPTASTPLVSTSQSAASYAHASPLRSISLARRQRSPR